MLLRGLIVLATQHATDIKKILTLNLEAPIILTKFSAPNDSRRRGRVITFHLLLRKLDLVGYQFMEQLKVGLKDLLVHYQEKLEE